MGDPVTKMVTGLLPDGTLIRACEVTFGHLEKQDNRIEKLEAALREIAEISDFRSTHPMSSEADYFRIARKALEGKDD